VKSLPEPPSPAPAAEAAAEEAAVEEAAVEVEAEEPPHAVMPRAAAETPTTFRKSRREIAFFIRNLLFLSLAVWNRVEPGWGRRPRAAPRPCHKNVFATFIVDILARSHPEVNVFRIFSPVSH